MDQALHNEIVDLEVTAESAVKYMTDMYNKKEMLIVNEYNQPCTVGLSPEVARIRIATARIEHVNVALMTFIEIQEKRSNTESPA